MTERESRFVILTGKRGEKEEAGDEGGERGNQRAHRGNGEGVICELTSFSSKKKNKEGGREEDSERASSSSLAKVKRSARL